MAPAIQGGGSSLSRGGGMFVLRTSIQVTKWKCWEVGHGTMKCLLPLLHFLLTPFPRVPFGRRMAPAIQGGGSYVLNRYSRIPVAQTKEHEHRIPPG